MTKEPKIFTVHVFRPVENKCMRLDVHYVVGFTSADAEDRIKKEEGQHLDHGRRFILTDEHMVDHPRSCQLYTTRYTNEDAMSRDAFNRWVRSMTTASNDDGIIQPAAFREF